METLPNLTLVFLVKKTDGQISEICLALKKRGFGIDKWNGVGGKLNPGEAIVDGAKRETKEEVGVKVLVIEKVAINEFYFFHKPEWNQRVHVFICEKWEGEILETEEMKPRWFPINEIPYNQMWADDIFWLPKIISGQKLKAKFVFENEQEMIEKEIEII